jgi:hypothetical protein
MIRSLVFGLTLLFSSAGFASEFTIAPSAGTTNGGTEVTIRGEFGDHPYVVRFDGTPAQSTVRVDAHTLVAVTPPHPWGGTHVVVFENGIGIETGLTFAFVIASPKALERILIPLLTPPIHGAFGSEFHTSFRGYNASESEVGADVYGLEMDCFPCPVGDVFTPLGVGPNSDFGPVIMSGTPDRPGRFLYVAPDQAGPLEFNLRVRDVTREGLNFGTEIPVVREREFRSSRVTLIGVPTDSRFRNTLRVYATALTDLIVTFSNGTQRVERSVTMQHSREPFDPEYATIGDFPVFAGQAELVTITIDSVGSAVSNPPAPPSPIWAFVTVTNNETQAITTIAPQR